MFYQLSRRHALQGIGAALSLPMLECMLPVARAAAASKPPVRLVWLYVGSGMFMPAYKPTIAGRDWANSIEHPADTTKGFSIEPELKPLFTMEPLLPHKEHVSILSGLYHRGAFARNAVVVRHGQDGACHLTGVDLGQTPGIAAKNGVSIDQVAARTLGEHTRRGSLSISHDRNMTINYGESGSPIPAEWNPWEIFHGIFGDNKPEDRLAAESRFQRRKSLLDDVLEESRSLHRSLGSDDRRRIEQYMEHVREVERRAATARKWADQPSPKIPVGASQPPREPPQPLPERVRLLLDMIVIALQTDTTRVATACMGHMGDVYRDLGYNDAYHGYTHEAHNRNGQLAMAQIDRARIGVVAYFLDKLKSITEADGSTLLDNSLVHFGGGMGSWHESTDLANFIAGHGGGKFKLGDHQLCDKQPLANLYVAMLQAAGVPIDKFADSTGPLSIA